MPNRQSIQERRQSVLEVRRAGNLLPTEGAAASSRVDRPAAGCAELRRTDQRSDRPRLGAEEARPEAEEGEIGCKSPDILKPVGNGSMLLVFTCVLFVVSCDCWPSKSSSRGNTTSQANNSEGVSTSISELELLCNLPDSTESVQWEVLKHGTEGLDWSLIAVIAIAPEESECFVRHFGGIQGWEDVSGMASSRVWVHKWVQDAKGSHSNPVYDPARGGFPVYSATMFHKPPLLDGGVWRLSNDIFFIHLFTR